MVGMETENCHQKIAGIVRNRQHFADQPAMSLTDIRRSTGNAIDRCGMKHAGIQTKLHRRREWTAN